MTQQHSPTPWRIDNFNFQYPDIIVDKNGRQVARAMYWSGRENSGEVEANARFLVAAVNAHEDLLAALGGLLADVTSHENSTVHWALIHDPETVPSFRAARAALAKHSSPQEEQL